MLDLRRLVILRELALRKSIRGAAQSLNYSSSAVSQHLAALERECGAVLLERGHNTIRLTEAGRALVRHTDRLLEDMAAAESELQGLAGLETGSLTLASFASAAMELMPASIRAFSARFPGVAVSFFEADPEHTVPMLKAGDADLALIYEYDFFSLSPESGLAYVLLADEVIQLIVPRDHWAAQRSSVALADLAQESWIVEPRADCHHFTVRACAAAGYEARTRCESSNYAVTQALVATGLGLALVPSLALGTPHPEVAVKALDGPAPRRRILAAHRRASAGVPAVQAMLGILREVADGPPASGRVKRMRVPEGLSSTQMRPPWAKTIPREMASPSPAPDADAELAGR